MGKSQPTLLRPRRGTSDEMEGGRGTPLLFQIMTPARRSYGSFYTQEQVVKEEKSDEKKRERVLLMSTSRSRDSLHSRRERRVVRGATV